MTRADNELYLFFFLILRCRHVQNLGGGGAHFVVHFCPGDGQKNTNFAGIYHGARDIGEFAY